MRAIFDNAGFVIPGEDVKIAGVKVGKIASLDVTDGLQGRGRARDHRARLPGLPPRRELHRAPAEPDRRALRRVQADAAALGQRARRRRSSREIDDGPGKGQHLLPVENTMQTVDIDLIGNTMREPERERLSLILNELGTGLAGRGQATSTRSSGAPTRRCARPTRCSRSSPRQNTQLEQLAVNSDTMLAPLARDRARVASAIRNSSDVAKATAEKRDALAADIQTLPRVPRRARADDGAARLARRRVDAGARRPAAPRAGDINNVVRRLGPFSQAAIPAVDSLGEASKTGTPRRHRRAARDRRPARAGEGRAARRRDAARGARVLPRHRRHRAR